MHLFKQDSFYGPWVPNEVPPVYSLEWDPREENQVDFGHTWVIEYPAAAVAGAFLKSPAVEPPIKPGTRDPYVPPKPGEIQIDEHLEIGPITHYVTTLHQQDGKNHNGNAPQPDHGMAHHAR